MLNTPKRLPLLCLLPIWIAATPLTGTAAQSEPVVPIVAALSVGEGTLDSRSLTTIRMPDEWTYTADALSSLFAGRTGTPLRQTMSDSAAINIVHDSDMGHEAYRLTVGKCGVDIAAGSARAAGWALSTLAQISDAHKDCILPCMTINDSPQFGYRGLMLDCARHFRSTEDLESVVDAMNLMKLNVLHLHLTDNQAWRLALEKHPNVAPVGTHYADFPELSGKYYTADQLRSLVDYAQRRGIEIIPEVDMPAHCLSLLASMPGLSCRGGEFEPFPEERRQADRKRAWENTLCIGNDSVYSFLDDLVGELASIFTSRYIHLGGDEASTARWQECPRCQALYRREHMTSPQQLQDYFTRRAGETVRRHGRTLMGWDEINDRHAADRSDRLTIWQRDANARRDKAVARGMQVVMCPKDPCYFDFGYARNSTKKVYSWSPVDSIANGQQQQVAGGEACLWTEFVATKADVDRMLYPRLCALAEVLWHGSGSSFTDFCSRLRHTTAILRRTGNAVYNEDFAHTAIFDAEASRPRLLSGATIDTDMPGIRFYDKEYAFDGDTTTFFATPYSDVEGAHFTVTLNQAVDTRRVGVLFDRSKEFPHGAELQVSADGTTFNSVAEVTADGRLEARFRRKRRVKALRLVLTREQKNRLSIREFYLH